MAARKGQGYGDNSSKTHERKADLGPETSPRALWAFRALSIRVAPGSSQQGGDRSDNVFSRSTGAALILFLPARLDPTGAATSRLTPATALLAEIRRKGRR
ncbi:uncharacterized protein LOC144582045 isoform X2 [Callithrix jacchus]